MDSKQITPFQILSTIDPVSPHLDNCISVNSNPVISQQNKNTPKNNIIDIKVWDLLMNLTKSSLLFIIILSNFVPQQAQPNNYVPFRHKLYLLNLPHNHHFQNVYQSVI